jgi:tetratricopeptide (TPR) repeat protein
MQKTVALLPGDAESHNNLGITFRNLGRLDESEASYRRALQINPDYAQAHNNLGATLQELGRLDDAVASYRRALQIKPDYAQAHANLGAVERARNRQNNQTTQLPDIFDEPGFDEAQLSVGRGDCASAMTIYAGIGASQAERHYQDALVLEQRNNKQGALSLLKYCVMSQPTHLPALLKQAQLLSGVEAEKVCRQVLKAFPGHLEASLRLVGLLIDRDLRMEAVSVLAAAIPASPDGYENHFLLANYWWQLGNYSAAEPQMRHCIRMNKVDARPYQVLLEQFNRQDRITDVEELCREYLQLNPEDQQMRIALAKCLVRQRRWGDAGSVYLGLMAEFPDWVSISQLYGEMLEKCGRTDDALAIFQRNIERIPDALDVYLPLADLQYKSGNRELALETCRRIALKYMDSDDWGLHLLPIQMQSRLIYHQLDEVAGKYCTGQRAFFDNTELDISRTDFAFGDVVELFCMVVGQEHIDFLEHVAYPALSSTQDFDKLLAEHKVIYNIYTTPADFERMRGFLDKLVQRGIRYRVNVELLSFSQELYSILTLPIIDQVKRSLALRSAVVMALPDAIISGSIYRVLKDMKPFETVVCAMPRIDSEVAYTELKKFFADTNNKGLDSRKFVRKSMTDFRHPQTYSALVSENNCLSYRDRGNYYLARNFAPPPLCFYAREEMLHHMIRNPLCGPNSIASFYAIDHDFVDSAHCSNNLRLIDNSDYFFWAEFTHPARHAEFLAGRQAEDYYAPESTKSTFQNESKWICGE